MVSCTLGNVVLLLYCLEPLYSVLCHGGHMDDDVDDDQQLPSTSLPNGNRRLLLISFDAFRYDFLKRLPAPNNFTILAKRGFLAEKGIEPSFFTKTFPAHYSILTGLYQESHRIYYSKIYDPDLKTVVDLQKNDPATAKYYGGEPIYITVANYLGSTEKIGCVMFVSCELDIQNKKLVNNVPYDDHVSLRQRFDLMVDFFSENHVQLGLLYSNEPDATGHSEGTTNGKLDSVMQQLNDDVGYLIHKLETKNLLNSLNIVITADHGMTDLLGSVQIQLRPDLFNISIDAAEAWFIDSSKVDEAFTYLSSYLTNSGQNSSAKVYKKSDMPTRWNYKLNDRLSPLVLFAEAGYNLVSKDIYSEHAALYPAKGGAHGYDNALQDMRPIFLASGPAFHSDEDTLTKLKSVDIYELMCAVLGIPEPLIAPNNGSRSLVRRLLKPSFLKSNLHSSDEYESREKEELFHVSETLAVVLLSCGCTISFSFLIYVLHRLSYRRGWAYWRLRTPYRVPDTAVETDDSEDELYSSPQNGMLQQGSQHVHNGGFVKLPTSNV